MRLSHGSRITVKARFLHMLSLSPSLRVTVSLSRWLLEIPLRTWFSTRAKMFFWNSTLLGVDIAKSWLQFWTKLLFHLKMIPMFSLPNLTPLQMISWVVLLM
uniref:Uncharacterized protein n=1 Tax=Opuntia streptacantha TaxID=393608 RepID=A0A7C9D6Z5_OPUST